MSADFKDLLVRAAKTAVQTFGALVTVDVVFKWEYATIEVALVSGAAAGVSVIWNAILAWSRS